jgi:RNA polymerase-interacting CarD/CdnL/TRCF family regulator
LISRPSKNLQLYARCVNWKTLAAVGVVVTLAALLWRRMSAPTTAAIPDAAPPRPEQVFSIGQTVVLNAMGVGKVEEFTVRPLRDGRQAWGYVIKVRHYDAFAPAEKVPGLVWPRCDRATAEAMYKAILEPDTSVDPPSPEARKTRMMSLWATGTHMEQAELLGQVLRASSSEDSAIVIGSGHILREIASVLGIPIRELDARLETRFPKWRAHLPERDPDDI